jgi:hypothetical protein
VNNELVRTLRKQLWFNVRSYASIYLEELRKYMKYPGWSPYTDLSLGFSNIK